MRSGSCDGGMLGHLTSESGLHLEKGKMDLSTEVLGASALGKGIVNLKGFLP